MTCVSGNDSPREMNAGTSRLSVCPPVLSFRLPCFRHPATFWAALLAPVFVWGWLADGDAGEDVGVESAQRRWHVLTSGVLFASPGVHPARIAGGPPSPSSPSALAPCSLPGLSWVPGSRAVPKRPAATRPRRDGSLCQLSFSMWSFELSLVEAVLLSALPFSSLPFPPSPFISFHLFVSVFAFVLGSAFSQCSLHLLASFLCLHLDFVSRHAGVAFAVSRSLKVFHWEVEGGWGAE